MTEEKESSSNKGLKVYELGVHIISSVAEEKVYEVWNALKAGIKKHGGTEIGDEAPKLMDLAYMMVKHVHGKNVRHTTAYFAWVKFEIDSTEVPALNELVAKNENVLRHIIIKTVKENTLHGHKFASESKEGKHDNKRTSSSTSIIPEAPMAEVEVDKAIDNIVKE